MYGEGCLRRISSDCESSAVPPGEQDWAAPPRAPAAVLVNISFLLILMELQGCINAILKTSPPILGKYNNVMENTGTKHKVCQCHE